MKGMTYHRDVELVMGSGSDDVRIESIRTISKLSEELKHATRMPFFAGYSKMTKIGSATYLLVSCYRCENSICAVDALKIAGNPILWLRNFKESICPLKRAKSM